jgi:diguanylate cyclase (GGDEF)-like protein
MAVILALPAWSAFAWTALGILAAGAVVLGVMRNRPRTLWPWGLLAAVMLCSAAADTIYTVVEAGAPYPLINVANTLYLLWLIGAGFAFHRLARSGSARGNRAGLIDAVTVTIATLLVVWVGVVGRAMPDLSTINNPALLTYPLGDVLLLGTVVRLLTSRRGTGAVAFLATGIFAALTADVVHAFVALGGGWSADATSSIAWLLCYACWGAAGLHPSMARLTEPEVLPEREVTARRLSVIVLTSLTAPAILLIEAFSGDVRNGVALAIGGGVIVLLNLGSVAAAANTDRRSLVYRDNHDTLTGLANRAFFADRLANEAARSRAGGPTTAVALINLDGFKLVNETLGHSVGDEVLVMVARRLARGLGRHDLAARLGSDEFAILVSAAGPRDVEDIAARVARTLSDPVMFAGREIRLTASIGVATTADTQAEEDLLGHAGLALQAARASGLGQWCRYKSELHGLMVERMRLRTALAQAVADGSFMLQYQPIVAIDSGIAVGFEALVRWEHPTRGLVAPSEFIELAEETGLIEPIGDWVLRRAVTAAAHWYRTLPHGPYVSVNVSALQFRTPGFAEKVDRELASAGLPASHLMVELTESVLFREDDHVWAELETLRNNGVRLAIDDFGTGFSSLRYLLQTPIDVIKIDKTFVSTLASSTRHRVLVDGIVRLAKTLGLHVVAEGIETVADRDQLAEMGCPFGQGYLYSVPLTSSDVNLWLAVAAKRPTEKTVRDEPQPPPEHLPQTSADGEYAHSGVLPVPPGTLPA